MTCTVATGHALVEAGLHPAAGGTGLHACTGTMLLEALALRRSRQIPALTTLTGLPISLPALIAPRLATAVRISI